MDRPQQRVGYFVWSLAVLLGVGARGAAAQSESPPPQQQVTVEAHREALERRVRQFVTAITADAPGESLERWTRPMCPLVAGLTAQQGEQVLSRVSQIAREAGAPLGPEHCDANLFIIVTPDPKAAIEAWRKRSDGQIFNGASFITVDRFVGTERPVRAWYNAGVTDANGVALPEADVTFAHGADAGSRVSVNTRADDSHLQLGEVKNLVAVMLFVNSHSIEHLKLQQLADYLGMIGLAKLDTGAHASGSPTILNLFASDRSEPPPDGLTQWDAAFLRALYHTDLSATMQRSAITRVVVDDIEP